MRVKKLPILWICLVCGLLFFTPDVMGEATLLSIKKGAEGDKSWAVFTFDEKALWFGISQSEGNKLSLYFLGKAGALEGSTVPLDPVSAKNISIKSMSRTPSVFRADIVYDEDIPITVLKKNRYLLVAFNDERLSTGKMAEFAEDVSPTPGRLVNVTPVIRDDRVMTLFEFDGSYDWVGYLRPSRDKAVLLIRGARRLTSKSDFSFADGSLRAVRLSSEEGRDLDIKAEMIFIPRSSFSIVRKARVLMVETPYVRTRQARRVEEREAPPEVAISEQEVKEPRTEESRGEALEQKVPVEAKGEESVEERTAEEKRTEEEKADEIPWDREVSFDFRSTPIKDALRLLAASNELNMVIGEGVEGGVTMNLDGVTLKQALDMIVHTHDCDYIVDRSVITVKPVSVQFSGGRVTKVYRLKYADAVNVAKVVRQVVTNDSLVQVFYSEFLNFDVAAKSRIKSREVAIQGIRRSSVLVVTDRPEKIREVDRVIRELDIQPVQIMIESKLVELSPIHTDQLGINWDKTLTAALWQQNILDGGGLQDYSVINTEPDRGGEWRMGSLTASKYAAVLDFLKEKTDSKLKSNPRLLAMDNEESSISVGTTVPVPRIQRGLGGQGDMVTFEYKEVNIQLNVTPHSVGSDEITMYVNPVIEEISGWVEYLQHRAPITDKRSVNSIVTVKNGETVVIGGLIKSQRVRTTQKVWLLGSLPLLGKLFQHEKYEDKQTDLMIFITPTIVQAG